MCGNVLRPSGATPVCCLAARRATYGQYKLSLDGPFRRANNGPSQMVGCNSKTEMIGDALGKSIFRPNYFRFIGNLREGLRNLSATVKGIRLINDDG